MLSQKQLLHAIVTLMTLLVVGTGLPSFASAQVEDPSYASAVVQKRKYDPTHEFTLTAGLLPLDAFQKGVTLGGSYTLHFSHALGWEILQGAYSFKVETELNQELEVFDLRPSPFEVLDWFVSSNIVYKPLYWKGAWQNSGLWRGEFLVLAGGAYGSFTRSKRPGVNLGTGIRFFITEMISLRFDARYLWFFGDNLLEEFDVQDELWLGIGTSLAF